MNATTSLVSINVLHAMFLAHWLCIHLYKYCYQRPLVVRIELNLINSALQKFYLHFDAIHVTVFDYFATTKKKFANKVVPCTRLLWATLFVIMCMVGNECIYSGPFFYIDSFIKTSANYKNGHTANYIYSFKRAKKRLKHFVSGECMWEYAKCKPRNGTHIIERLTTNTYMHTHIDCSQHS